MRLVKDNNYNLNLNILIDQADKFGSFIVLLQVIAPWKNLKQKKNQLRGNISAGVKWNCNNDLFVCELKMNLGQRICLWKTNWKKSQGSTVIFVNWKLLLMKPSVRLTMVASDICCIYSICHASYTIIGAKRAIKCIALLQ